MIIAIKQFKMLSSVAFATSSGLFHDGGARAVDATLSAGHVDDDDTG